jgi:hypothetical protein
MSREVKSSPTQMIAEPPKPTALIPPTKKGFVLKGRQSTTVVKPATWSAVGLTNGGLANPTPKKARWADMDDEEDFVASITTQKTLRITTLEKDVEHKSARIDALDATVSIKDTCIGQLEQAVEGKNIHIKALEAEVDEKTGLLEGLKEDNHKQYLYVQELVAEVDEKSRRILELETELDAKGSRIRELEMESESHTQVSEDDIPLFEEDAGQNLHLPKPEVADVIPEVLGSRTSETTQTSKLSTTCFQLPVEPVLNSPTVGVREEGPPHHLVSGPTVNDSKFPKLWSPDDKPKSAAPVEKPKVLKMAIDTSKFGKKHTPIVAKKHELATTKCFSAPSHGQSSKHRATTEVVPKFDTQKDIRHMSHAQRVLFANGPMVMVMMGHTKLATLPKYVLMQCSVKAHKHFIDNPNATSITFPAGSMDTEAAKKHLNWMDEMTYQGRVYSITLNGDAKYDTRNLKICQAARVMGLNNTYVGHFTKVLCDRVRSNKSSPELIAAICEVAYPANDPIFDCLANNLVNQQLGKAFKQSEELAELLVKYPVLREKMVKVEQRVKDSRAGEKRKETKSQETNKNRIDSNEL